MDFPIQLAIILVMAVLGAVLAVRLRQPTVIGLILIGAIAGQNALGWVTDQGLISISIEIGAILLLFTLGIEFSIPRLVNLGSRVVIVAVVKLGICFLGAFYISLLFGLSFIASLYIGVMLSITSTVVFVKILEQLGFAKREEMPLLVGVLIIEDIYGIFALTFFSSIETAADIQPIALVIRVLLALAVLGGIYLLLQKRIANAINWVVSNAGDEIITLVALGLCGGLAYAASALGLSASVGAFLAGNLVASLPNSKKFEESIHPFTLTFTSLFFFSVGTTVNFGIIFDQAWLLIVLLVINTLLSFVGIAIASYLFGNFSGKSAIFAGIAMIPIGEFSLLLAKEANASVPEIDLVSLIAVIILMSSIIFALTIKSHEKLYFYIERKMPLRTRAVLHSISSFFNSVSFEMLKEKVEASQIVNNARKALMNIVLLAFIIGVLFFIARYFNTLITSTFNIGNIWLVIIPVMAILVAVPLSRIFSGVRQAFASFKKLMRKMSPQDEHQEGKLLFGLFVVLLSFLLLIIMPQVIYLLRLPAIFNLIVLLLLGVLLYYGIRSYNTLLSFSSRGRRRINSLSRKYTRAAKKIAQKYSRNGKFRIRNNEGKVGMK